MSNIEDQLHKTLANEDIVFKTSDDELIKNAVKTANVSQGGKDIIILGMASIWIVFANLLIKIFNPVFKSMAKKRSE